MNNLDFFAEYESNKRKAQAIFESLNTKINLDKDSRLDEALFGLIKTTKDREKALKDYFFKLTKSPNWQSYSVDLDSTGKQVKIENATSEDLDDAWEFLRQQAAGDEFKGAMKQDGDSIIYQKGGKDSNAQDSSQDVDSDADSNTQQSQSSAPTYQLTYDKKQGKYFFGSSDRFATKINNAASEIQTYDFKRSPLKVLFEDPLKFGLREITFDFKEGVIASARDGFWIGDFTGKFLQADFIGNNFRGRFFANNEDWRSKPTAFISGTFTDNSQTGILGLNDVKQGNENYAFHLIQLPPSHSVEILTDKQLRHTITCEKRMDISNSNFIYSVYMGYDIDQASPKSVTLTWETIRTEYDAYKVSGKMNSLPDLFSLASDEKIIELRVVELGTPPSFKKKERFDSTKEYIENTSGLRGLKQVSGSRYNRDLKFDITNDSDFENFNKIKGYINSNQFANDLKQASIYLDNKLISSQDIKNKFPYLVNVFTSEVLKLKEAVVNLANPRKSYGRRTYSSRSSVKNPLTGKKFEQPYEISDYLDQKYKTQISANGGKRPASYEKEYQELYNDVFGSKNTPTSKSKSKSSSVEDDSAVTDGMSKEESAVLKRIENFVKYFVYKIDDGRNTNKVRKYFMDMLKAKITAHKEPANTKPTSVATSVPIATQIAISKVAKPTTATPTATPATAPVTAPTAKPAAKPAAKPTAKPTAKTKVPKKGGAGNVKESIIRNEIRNIFKDLL